MEDYNRSAKRRADEAAMDKKSKKKNVRPRSRTDSMKNTRPKQRPVDVSPTAEADDQEFVKGMRDGGMVRGCKGSQVGGKKFSGTY